MCRVFCVVLVLALLCCCSCVFAVEDEPQVAQVDAECAGDGNVARWQLPGTSLWYNCTTAAAGFGQMICGMGVGNCEPEDVQRRIKDGANGGVFTINVSTFTPSQVNSWWQRKVESKAVTVAIGAAKPPEVPPGSPEDNDSRDSSSRADSESPPADAADSAGAPSLAGAPGGAGESVPATRPEEGPPGPREHKDSRDASQTDSESSPAVVENSADVPSPPPPATPGGAGANSAAGAAATTDPSAAASQASDSAPAAELQGAAHSTSAASAASESPPDPKPTGGSHSSHDPPVELQEETAAAPPTQLSQTGEDGGAAEGAEEDAANTTTETASGEGNNMAASMPAPLSSAPTKNALENSVGTDACFHETRLHALPLLVLAALTYGTLG
ncbi:90 kDa surface protein [Trypanosoma cruzi]|nr:90 kDa surface protein [Trypanosoma cruzi]